MENPYSPTPPPQPPPQQEPQFHFSQPPPPAPTWQRQSAWPKVTGIIGIVLGCFEIFGGISSIAMPALGGALEKMGAGNDAAFPMEVFTKYAPLMRLIGYLALGLGVGLVLFSILLLMRKRAAVPALVLLALAKIAFTFWQVPASTEMGKEMTRQQASAMKKGNGPDLSGIMDAASAAGVIVGAVMGCALPVFHLIWFSRRKIREEVAGWGRQTPEARPGYQNM